MQLKDVFKNAKEKMDKAMDHMVHNFSTLRTGRASAAVVEGVQVEAYGQSQPIPSLASISTPDAHTIAIKPWDASLMGAIEKALQAANLGMNPSNDGQSIRLNVPPMTEERRKDIVKEAHRLAEEGRVAIRGVRRHAMDEVKKLEKEKAISEDESKKATKEVQEITDKHIKMLDERLAKKEQEILKV